MKAKKRNGTPPEVFRMLRGSLHPAMPPWGADGVPPTMSWDAQAGCPTAQAGGTATVARVVSPDDPQPLAGVPFKLR